MRTIFFLLSIAISQSLISQTKEQHSIRLGYLFSYLPDSTNQEYKKSDYMYLDIITDTGSIFYSEDVRKKDELIKENGTIIQQMMNSGVTDGSFFKKFETTGIDETIIKYYKSSELVHGVYAGQFRSYTESIPSINWQLQNDTLSINGFFCQKAIAFFGGRSYIAWFSKTIEVTDGPWKFSGLPGGIVKVYDTQNYFTYELKEIIKLDKEKIVLQLNQDAGFYPSTKKKVLQLMKSYYEDPTGTAETMGTTSSNTTGRKSVPKYYNPQERE
jgi:GLPGLI family protein